MCIIFYTVARCFSILFMYMPLLVCISNVIVFISGKKSPCGAEHQIPSCHKTCESGYSVSYEDDKHFGESAYSVSREVEKIQTEIMTNGPVEGAFTVYEDFLNYKSGMSAQL